jgi:acyl carrier protein
MNDSWKQTTLKTIEKIFQKQFFQDHLCVTEYSTPADIEAWDSLAHIHLLIEVEKAFKLRFTADEMSQIDSVAALLKVLWDRGVK